MSPMNRLKELEEHIMHQLQNLGRLSLKYQNKQLTECGDIVVKLVDPRKDFVSFDSLATESQKWNLPIEKVCVKDEMIKIFLKREIAYRCFIVACLTEKLCPKNNTYPQIILNSDVDTKTVDNMNMTNFRVRTITRVVQNLFEFAGYNISSNSSSEENTMFVNISSKRSKTNSRCVDLVCGAVISNGISADDFIRKRANDMQLIAQHKYGIRVKDQTRFRDMITSLGRSAAIVDMLESKASSPIDIRKEKNQSSKGAAFILYNYARINVLLETFSEKQRVRYYPDLPPIEQIDFTLLSEEDEWTLFWVYVVGFPTMLTQALGDGQLSRLSPHLVLNFASGLVICLSKYYRRVRILTENRDHLLPIMYTRIYLLKCLLYVLSILLTIMDLEPVTHM